MSQLSSLWLRCSFSGPKRAFQLAVDVKTTTTTSVFKTPMKTPMSDSIAGIISEFPIPTEYLETTYTDLLSSELRNTDNLVISQSISNRQLTAIFAPDASFKPRPGLCWGTKSSLNDLLNFLQAEKSKGRHVFSIASDNDFGFGVCTMEGYGTNQIIFTDYLSVLKFQKTTDRDFAISAVASRGFQFCFIMTEGVKMYTGKKQLFYIKPSWTMVEEAIHQGWDIGLNITELYYTKKTGLYYLVMTESTEGQYYQWGMNNDVFNAKVAAGYHPTLVLLHQTNDMILTIMPTASNRSGYKIILKHPIKA